MCHKIPDKAIVVVNPLIAANQSLNVTLSKFLRVIQPCYQSITVVGGNLSIEQDITDVNLNSYPISRAKSKMKRLFDNLCLQFKMMFWILKTVHSGMPVFFWIADKMLLPFVAAKFKKTEINFFVYGNMAIEGNTSYFTRYSSALICKMARHSDFVCIESPSVINNWPSLLDKKSRVLHLYTNSIEFAEIEKRENVIGMVCRLSEGKHVVECIQAMIALHSKHPDWILEIIGTGRQEQLCKKIIADSNAEEFIKLHGWVGQSEITSIARKWKYLLFPTDTEGMPNGLIEIMGLGIPAVCSQVGGICDIVKDGQNGLSLSDTSVNIIKDTVEKVVDIACQIEVYEKLSRNAFLKIQNNFTLKAAQRLAIDTLRN